MTVMTMNMTTTRSVLTTNNNSLYITNMRQWGGGMHVRRASAAYTHCALVARFACATQQIGKKKLYFNKSYNFKHI